jgi:hypothetical protein
MSEGDVWRTGLWLRTGELVVQCLRACELPAGAPADRLRALGSHLQALGAADPAELRDFLRARMFRQKALYLAHLEALLSEHGRAPSFWALDVERHAGAIRRAWLDPDYVVPADLRDGRDAVEAFALFQRIVFLFGRLLSAWPDIEAAVRSYRARGYRPGGEA